MCMFSRLLFVLFLLAVVLSVLRFTDSDYSFGIFKLFLACSPRVKLKTIKLVLVCVVSPLNTHNKKKDQRLAGSESG